MLRRFLVVTMIFSAAMFGMLPAFAYAAAGMDAAGQSESMHDCVCPPADGTMSPTDSGSCAPNLECMISCAISVGIVTESPETLRSLIPHAQRFAEIIARALSASFPPFRPPCL